MIRGCQKQIYYVKNPRSTLFAEAYFVLKGKDGPAPGKEEMASEAQRIVEAFDRTGRCRSPRDPVLLSGQRLGAFVVGAASSSAIIGIIALLLAFA
ncbi:MAG: hypothetical protein IJ480_05195 [Clostridia bacterium]|nr:hypothetical protein [Clostridia bacterium]